MPIEAVDFFYLSMPVVTDAGDGSQDALVVRVVADGVTGWGECEASPLVSIAAFVAPMSHGACRGVRNVVMGRPVDGPADIAAISATLCGCPRAWISDSIATARRKERAPEPEGAGPVSCRPVNRWPARRKDRTPRRW